MTYVKSERDEFVRRMSGIVRQAKEDFTSSKDYSTPGDPSSTYSANLARLRTLTDERLRQGVSPDHVLTRITANLMPPYKTATEERIREFKAAGATDRDCIDALMKVYDTT